MKTIAYLFFFLLSAGQCIAQTDFPKLTVSARYGITPYEHANGLGMGIQYTHPIGRILAFSGSVGWMHGNYLTSTQTFSFSNREFVMNADVSALVNLAPKARRHTVFFGGGGSIMHTLFNYGQHIHPGGVTMRRHISTLPMVHILLEDHYMLGERWAITGRAIVRSSLNERDVVQRNINDSGQVGTSGGIRHQYSFELGVTYSFKTGE